MGHLISRRVARDSCEHADRVACAVARILRSLSGVTISDQDARLLARLSGKLSPSEAASALLNALATRKE